MTSTVRSSAARSTASPGRPPRRRPRHPRARTPRRRAGRGPRRSARCRRGPPSSTSTSVRYAHTAPYGAAYGAPQPAPYHGIVARSTTLVTFTARYSASSPNRRCAVSAARRSPPCRRRRPARVSCPWYHPAPIKRDERPVATHRSAVCGPDTKHSDRSDTPERRTSPRRADGSLVSGGGWCGGRDDRGPARLRRHGDVVGPADLAGVQRRRRRCRGPRAPSARRRRPRPRPSAGPRRRRGWRSSPRPSRRRRARRSGARDRGIALVARRRCVRRSVERAVAIGGRHRASATASRSSSLAGSTSVTDTQPRTSHDPRRRVAPVAVAQQPLVELARSAGGAARPRSRRSAGT